MDRFLDNNKVMSVFQSGDYVYDSNFDNRKSIKLLKKLKPKNFIELCNIYGLNRFGLESSLNLYIKNKNNPKDIKYNYPFFEDNLKETYGVLIYTEQLVKIIEDFSGLTNGQSEATISYIISRKTNLISKQYSFFKESCLTNKELVTRCNFTNDDINVVIEDLWNFIYQNAMLLIRYSFVLNKVAKSYELVSIRADYISVADYD